MADLEKTTVRLPVVLSLLGVVVAAGLSIGFTLATTVRRDEVQAMIERELAARSPREELAELRAEIKELRSEVRSVGADVASIRTDIEVVKATKAMKASRP